MSFIRKNLIALVLFWGALTLIISTVALADPNPARYKRPADGWANSSTEIARYEVPYISAKDGRITGHAELPRQNNVESINSVFLETAGERLIALNSAPQNETPDNEEPQADYSQTTAFMVDPGARRVNQKCTDQGAASEMGSLAYHVGAMSGEGEIVLAGGNTYTLKTDLVVPANVTMVFMRGAVIQGPGKLTINGGIQAGRYKIFDTSTLKVDGTPDIITAYPEWFTDENINEAISFVAGAGGGKVQFAGKTYTFGYTITMREGVNLAGVSVQRNWDARKRGTRLVYTGSGKAIEIGGDKSGTASHVRLTDLYIIGQGTDGIHVGTSGIANVNDVSLDFITVKGFKNGFHFSSCYGVTARKCVTVGALKNGFLFDNRENIGLSGKNGLTYGSFISCGVYGSRKTLYGFHFNKNLTYSTLYNCFVESAAYGFYANNKNQYCNTPALLVGCGTENISENPVFLVFNRNSRVGIIGFNTDGKGKDAICFQGLKLNVYSSPAITPPSGNHKVFVTLDETSSIFTDISAPVYSYKGNVYASQVVSANRQLIVGTKTYPGITMVREIYSSPLGSHKHRVIKLSVKTVDAVHGKDVEYAELTLCITETGYTLNTAFHHSAHGGNRGDSIFTASDDGKKVTVSLTPPAGSKITAHVRAEVL